MNTLEIVALLDKCRSELEEQGLKARDDVPLEDVHKMARALKKEYFTSFLSPHTADLTEQNCLWTWIFNEADEPMAMIGARLDDLGDRPLPDFAKRRVVGLSNEELPSGYVAADRFPKRAQEIKGLTVYVGDLKVLPGSKVSARCLTALHLSLLLLKWRRFDWMYAFARDRDMGRGAPKSYLLTEIHMGANSWTVPPTAENGEHWLLASTRKELERLVPILSDNTGRL